MTNASALPPGSRLHYFTAFLVCLLFATSCATTRQTPPDFLHSTNESWNQWIDKIMDVHLTDVRVAHLPLTDVFMGLSIVIAKADAPVREFHITLHAPQVTRRQALWLIEKKYGLKMTVEDIPGRPPYLGIARR